MLIGHFRMAHCFKNLSSLVNLNFGKRSAVSDRSSSYYKCLAVICTACLKEDGAFFIASLICSQLWEETEQTGSIYHQFIKILLLRSMQNPILKLPFISNSNQKANLPSSVPFEVLHSIHEVYQKTFKAKTLISLSSDVFHANCKLLLIVLVSAYPYSYLIN